MDPVPEASGGHQVLELSERELQGVVCQLICVLGITLGSSARAV